MWVLISNLAMQEISNKQHLLAEHYSEKDLVPSLCDLYVSHYTDCAVLVVFSSRDKNLMGYKIANPVDQLAMVEPWMKADFNQIITVSFTTDFFVTPAAFVANAYNHQKLSGQVMVDYEDQHSTASVHYLNGLITYHLLKKQASQLYVYRTGNQYSILLMNFDQCLLANSYQCDNETEVLYFLLNALQISDLLPSDATLNLEYSILKQTEMVKFLSPHFSKNVVLNYAFEHENAAVPDLQEKLFACYAASLCA